MQLLLSGHGAMGRMVESIAIRRGHTILLRSTSSILFPDDLPSHAGDCCIDFSVAAAVPGIVRRCAEAGIPLVIGTTGWQNDAEAILAPAVTAGIPVIHGSNFSIGAQILFRIGAEASRLMAAFPQYDVGIHEVHHTRKKDAPSGTAISLADAVLKNLPRKQSWRGMESAAPVHPEELLIASQRLGSVTGEHTLHFHAPEDELLLTHRAHSREGFAFGAVLAAEIIGSVRGIQRFDDIVFSHLIPKQS